MPRLTVPVSIALRRAILAQLDRFEAARARCLETPEDPDPLHDLRVAIRRARALVRQGRVLLARGERSALDGPLRRLGRYSGGLRDLDVAIAASRAEAAGSADPAVRGAATTLADALVAERRDRTPPLLRALTRSAPALGRARRRLARVVQSLDDDGAAVEAAWRPFVAARWRRAARRLARIDAIDRAELHTLRIRLKQVRALAVALPDRGAALPAVRTMVALATAWQDRLGDARDAAVRAEAAAILARTGARSEEVRMALDALADAWGRHAESAQAAARSAWREGGRDAFVPALEAAGVALADSGADGDTADASASAQAEAHDGHAVPREIERKYLLRSLPPAVLATAPLMIEQGYLPGEALIERVRRTTYPDGRMRCVRTVKLGRGVSRIEVEEPVSPPLFEALWALTASARLTKRRYVVPDATGAWEVDQFEDRDLVLAERELTDPSVPVSFPDWLAAHVVRDVTDEPAFTNVQLARDGAVRLAGPVPSI